MTKCLKVPRSLVTTVMYSETLQEKLKTDVKNACISQGEKYIFLKLSGQKMTLHTFSYLPTILEISLGITTFATSRHFFF